VDELAVTVIDPRSAVFRVSVELETGHGTNHTSEHPQ